MILTQKTKTTNLRFWTASIAGFNFVAQFNMLHRLDNIAQDFYEETFDFLPHVANVLNSKDKTEIDERGFSEGQRDFIEDGALFLSHATKLIMFAVVNRIANTHYQAFTQSVLNLSSIFDHFVKTRVFPLRPASLSLSLCDNILIFATNVMIRLPLTAVPFEKCTIQSTFQQKHADF